MRRLGLSLALTTLATVVAAAAAQPEVSGRDGGKLVRALDTSGPHDTPCRDVDVRGRTVDGGCSVRAYAFATRLTIRTAFGAMRFGDCTTNFAATFAADGRFWLDDLRIGGAAPCSDVWACAAPQITARWKSPTDPPPVRDLTPWRGRLLEGSGRGSLGRFHLCVETCAGRYEGDVEIALLPRQDGWVMRADSAGVGEGGLEIDADWELLESSHLGFRAVPR